MKHDRSQQPEGQGPTDPHEALGGRRNEDQVEPEARGRPLVSADPKKSLGLLIAELLDVLAGSHAPDADPQLREHKRARLAAKLRRCLARKGFTVSSEQLASSATSDVAAFDARKQPPAPEYVYAVTQCLELHREDMKELVRQWSCDQLQATLGAEFAGPVIKRLFNL